MKQLSSFTFATLLATFYGHGFITDPPARLAGDAMATACGQQMFSQQTSDKYGNIQGEMQVMGSDFNASQCNLRLCKGFQFADNAAGVQSFGLGQTVRTVVDIRAPNTGTANVSIVDTATILVVGEPLISWDAYASNSAPIPQDQKNFDITIPSDLEGRCTTAGVCVIQWFWDARSIDQTYEACIDFTFGGGSGGAPSEGPSTFSSAAPNLTPSSSALLSATTSIETGIQIPTSTDDAPSTSLELTEVVTDAPTLTAAPTTSAQPTFTTELVSGDGQKYICSVED